MGAYDRANDFLQSEEVSQLVNSAGPEMRGFVTKDSGERVEFDSGMVRDTQEGKPRYDLIPAMFLKRWAELMGRGADKYGERNWEQANGPEELERFKASAFRHFMQWFMGEADEDHAAAVAFNVAAFEFIKAKLAPPKRLRPHSNPDSNHLDLS